MNVGTPFYVIAKHMGWLAINYLVAYVYINQLHNAYGTAAAWELGYPHKYYVKSYSMLLD